ncbi:sulfurtransferase [Parvicella tangerina]|uniref:3-mercaptopyruvate sulfurtransferase n=1 Tax=Parvicella tangerina TaxID=2829795 RepID=A0A916JNI9_9FLAO|nr:sulfurtransferase [Parvicella tangerina]CAG5080975.1 3-mercaptopyruvate sulfurtransferase [Parvicella tangerina]
MTSPIINTKQLNAQLDNPNLILLDVSTPKVTGGNTDEQNQTIPGAIVVNLKRDFSDPSGTFPNTVPTPKQFEETCNRLGITNTSTVVVFDNLGVYSSPRVWWLFKLMGHQDVQVLDGGLPEWINSGYPTIESIAWDRNSMQNKTTSYVVDYQPAWVKSYDDIVQNTSESKFTIVDARSKGRFDGTAPEPRKHLQSGHIPNSLNLPYQEVLNENKFKSPQELNEIFSTLGADDKTTYSCGSGLTACIILLAGQLAGINSMNVFDGSWTAWAELQNLKKVD